MNRSRTAALLACAGVSLLLLLLYRLPDTAWGAALQDWGHVPLFGLFAGVLLALMRSASFSSRALPGGRAHQAAFAAAVALGALTELAQRFQPGRTASLADLARDALGAGCVLALAASFEPALRAGRLWRSRARRWTVRGVALAALLAVSAPLASLAWDYAERDRAFPRLLSFESAWEERFLTLQSAELVATPPPPGLAAAPHGERVGRLTLSPEAARAVDFTGYSGFFIDEPYPDWRAYRTLRFSVFSERPAPITLSLRIEDEAHQRDNTPGDRFNHDFSVVQGMNEIEIPLSEVERAPRTRRMDMERIRIVHLFVYLPDTPLRVHLDDWRLE
jgi:hypothetical protein